jgi:hypothetical protein
LREPRLNAVLGLIPGAGTMLLSGLLTIAAISGCAQYQPPSSYSTQLDTSGGLGPGDAITHASATIGRVTGVSSIGNGDSEISFEVDGSHAREIHNDSILVLNNLAAPPSLDVLNVDAMSHAAPPGTRLDGASSMAEAQMFITARGPGSYAQALSNLTGGNTAPPSAATVQMQQLMSQISQQTMANAASIPAGRYEIDKTRRELAGVERQLTRNGKIEQAERLRTSMGSLMPGLTAPANPLALPPTSPNPPK